MFFLKKVINRIKVNLYINETIIMYKLMYIKKHNSIATIKFATPENLKDILFFQNIKYIDIFKKFLSLGDKGYFAYIDGKCIHRSWVKSNSQVVTPHRLSPYQLKDNEIFIHYCETAQEARGKGVYPAVLTKICEDNKDKDILISVDEKNIPSVKGIEKVGFEKIKKIKVLVVLGFKYIRISDDK